MQLHVLYYSYASASTCGQGGHLGVAQLVVAESSLLTEFRRYGMWSAAKFSRLNASITSPYSTLFTAVVNYMYVRI